MKRYFINFCLLGLQVSALTLAASRAFADPTVRPGGMYRPRPTPPPPHAPGSIQRVRRGEGSEAEGPELPAKGLNMGPQDGDRLELGGRGLRGPDPRFGCIGAASKLAGASALGAFGIFLAHETADAFGAKSKLAAGVGDLLQKQGLPAQARSVLGNIRDEKGAFLIQDNTTGREYSLPKEQLARLMAEIQFGKNNPELDSFARSAAARNLPELLASTLMALQRNGHVLSFHVLEGGGWKPVTGQVEYDAGKYEVKVRSFDEPHLLAKKYPLSSVSFATPPEE
jgi:hypothetical protein